MNLQGSWLVQGYFDLSDRTGGASVTQRVRDSLAARLGRPPASVRIRSYPVGPAWRHTYWWGEDESPSAGAQFFARIAEEYPVLSVGVSVEKGLEDREVAPSAGGESWVMERNAWDWHRLTQRAADVIGRDVPACAALVSRPLVLRFVATRFARGENVESKRRTFVFRDGVWFERHTGTATADTVLQHLEDVDKRKDWWVDAYFACDLGPEEVDGISAEALAALLWNFAPIRHRLRSRGG